MRAGRHHVQRLGVVAGGDANRLVNAISHAALEVRAVDGSAAHGELEARGVHGLVATANGAARRPDVEVVHAGGLRSAREAG